MKKIYKLKYNTPSSKSYKGWEEKALPLGNEFIGAKIYGLINEEIVQFNEKSLWSGGTLSASNKQVSEEITNHQINTNTASKHYNGGNDTDRYEKLKIIQKLLSEGNIDKLHGKGKSF